MPISEASATDCNHVFCKACIETWQTTHNTCPMCRSFIGGNVVEDILDFVDEVPEDTFDEAYDLLDTIFGRVNYALICPPNEYPENHDILIDLEGEQDWIPQFWIDHYRSTHRNDMVLLLNSGVHGVLILNGCEPPEEIYYCHYCRYVAPNALVFEQHDESFDCEGYL